MSNNRNNSPCLQIGMIADDITGACDAGVQFAQLGITTAVALAEGFAANESCDLIVISTNSRGDAPHFAQEKVRAACGELARAGRSLAFKKIDSTLRGNLGCEIEAVMDSCGFNLALVAPAYPAMGRTIENGFLRVSESGSPDAVHLPTLVGKQTGLRIVHCGKTVVRGGTKTITERLENLRGEKTIVVLDSTSADDLNCIAGVGVALGAKALLCGSAGLATETARVLAEKHGKQVPHRSPSSRAGSSGVLFVMGSTSPVTESQVRLLERNVRMVRIEPGPKATEQINLVLKEGKHPLVAADLLRAENLLEQFRELDCSYARNMVLSGGDTALAVCRALDARGIKLEYEVLPGIPFGQMVGGNANGAGVVTKAGGFGTEDALERIADFLTEQEKQK